MSKKKLYVGKKVVAQAHVSPKYDMVSVLYENGFNEEFTKAQWDDVRSDTEYPDGEISVRKHEKLISRIIKDMKECRVTLQEHEWILQRVSESIGENYRGCLRKMFGVKEPEQIMLATVDVVLKEKELLKDKNEAKTAKPTK